jgi:hypothetical protein
MKVQLSKQAARSLGHKTPAEQAAEKARREQARAEKAAAEKAAREERERQRKEHRGQSQGVKNTALSSDQKLRESLEEFRKAEASASPRKQERVEQKAVKAGAEIKKAHDALRLAEDAVEVARRELDTAKNDLDCVLDEQEELRVRTYSFDAVRLALKATWLASQSCWEGTPAAYRKTTRDRALKNEVRKVLNLESSE